MTFKEARAEARSMATPYWAYIGRLNHGEWFASREKPTLLPKDVFFVHRDGRVLNYENFLKCRDFEKKKCGACITPLFSYHPRNRKHDESKEEWRKDTTILRVLNRCKKTKNKQAILNIAFICDIQMS